MQAQFNEALVTMYAGYHPDSWWIVTNTNNGANVGVDVGKAASFS
jgi:hypothetical protein